MKIVEKKCPNCGAVLDFKVGERDIACSHCRRKFAVQYDGVDFAKLGEEAVKSLKEIDINLKPIRNIALTLAIVIMGLGILLMIGFGVFGFISAKRAETRWRENEEQFEQWVEDSRDEYDRAVEEMHEKYNQAF